MPLLGVLRLADIALGFAGLFARAKHLPFDIRVLAGCEVKSRAGHACLQRAPAVAAAMPMHVAPC